MPDHSHSKPRPLVSQGQVAFGIVSVLTGLLGLYHYLLSAQFADRAHSSAIAALTHYNSRVIDGASHGARLDRFIDELERKTAKGEPLRAWALSRQRNYFPISQSSSTFRLELADGRKVTGRLHFYGSFLASVHTEDT